MFLDPILESKKKKTCNFKNLNTYLKAKNVTHPFNGCVKMDK